MKASSSTFAITVGALGLLACGPSGSSGGDAGAGTGDAGGTAADAANWADAASCEQGVDVVFVLDVSSSMGFVLENLQENIGTVVEAANELAPGAHFGLIAFADNYALDDTGSGGVIHTEAQTLVDAFAHYRSVYTNNDRNPGDGPDGPTFQNPICEENALDSLHAAAAEFPWREDAAHVVILATDDTFLERPDNYGDGNGDGDTSDVFPFPEGDYPAARTVVETTAALADVEARVFSFTRLEPPGPFQGCGTSRRHTAADAITWGWSAPFQGHEPFPAASGGSNFDLAAVQSGALSLAATINEVVLESHCHDVD